MAAPAKFITIAAASRVFNCFGERTALCIQNIGAAMLS